MRCFSLFAILSFVPPACSHRVPSDDASASAVIASADEAEIRAVLDRLYASFEYAPGGEPDFARMRACFHDGATFTFEPASGNPVAVKDVDAAIADWRAMLARRVTPSAGYEEWIERAETIVSGKVAYVDVTFGARRPGETSERRPGLDSVVLLREGREWKVLAFTVQYEAKP
jgi:hypothetical protein